MWTFQPYTHTHKACRGRLGRRQKMCPGIAVVSKQLKPLGPAIRGELRLAPCRKLHPPTPVTHPHPSQLWERVGISTVSPFTPGPTDLINSGPDPLLMVKNLLWISSNEVDDTRAFYTEWSKSERKTPIQYTNIYMDFRKMVSITLYARQQKTDRCIETFWTLWEKAKGWWLERIALKHVYYHLWNR